MPRPYVTTPSENIAEREAQVWHYHPDLCRQYGAKLAAYGWSCTPRHGWDGDQIAAFREGWHSYTGKRG